MAKLKQVLYDIAYDIVDRGLSKHEIYALVKGYYKIEIDFRTIKGKHFYETLCDLVEMIENGEYL